jgi:two-component system, NtrC family, sensor kinase
MTARADGTRTVAGTPLRHRGKAIGALVVFRDRLAPFTDEELALLQSFADQAVVVLLFELTARIGRSVANGIAGHCATPALFRNRMFPLHSRTIAG